jgi:predicted outer membrane protein
MKRKLALPVAIMAILVALVLTAFAQDQDRAPADPTAALEARVASLELRLQSMETRLRRLENPSPRIR